MTQTAAEKFRADPRVAAARKQLLDVLCEHQSGLDGVRPPLGALRSEYDDLLERFGELRGGKLFYPYLGSGMGRGPLVELADGSVKMDFIGGIGVHYFGHGHPKLVEACLDAALEDTVMQGNLQQNEACVRLLDTLLSMAWGGGARLAHGFLTTSGAMANENALKLVFHKRAPANRILAFKGCFCGRTLALSRITDKPQFRPGLPRTLSVDYVPFFDPKRPRQSTLKSVETLERHLRRHPGKHAAMILEPILGEGGYYTADPDFFTALLGVLRKAGVLVILDEIQTFARTTTPFAFQELGLDEFVDVVTVGKLTQVCATLFTDAVKPPPGLVSQTFTGSTSAIAAAQTILDTMNSGDFFGSAGRISRLGSRFTSRLQAMAQRHPKWVRGPYGTGAMVAFTPFDGQPQTAKALAVALFEAGLISFIAGSKPARVRFLLPIGAIDEADVDAACALLEEVMGRFAEGGG